SHVVLLPVAPVALHSGSSGDRRPDFVCMVRGVYRRLHRLPGLRQSGQPVVVRLADGRPGAGDEFLASLQGTAALGDSRASGRPHSGARMTRRTNARIAGFTFLFYIDAGIAAMI